MSVLVMVGIWAEPGEAVRDFSTARRSCADSAMTGGDHGKATPPLDPPSVTDRLCLMTEDRDGQVRSNIRIATPA